MNKFIVGLTGGIGSGKTTVANQFQSLGVDIVDADLVAREVVEIGSPALSKIADYFGHEVINQNGSLNRALLRNKVFNNDADKNWLNNLLHPLIRQQMLTKIAQTTSSYCLLVAPLLLENKLTHMVDRVLVIDVDETTQIQRASGRDNNSVEQIKLIMKSQISRAERLKCADDIIDNQHQSITERKEHITKLHQYYLTLAAV